MTPDCIQEAFARFAYQRNKRRPPDERQRGQFRAGWEDAAKRGVVYAEGTLKPLSWRSLGYRLGQHFGDQLPEQIDGAFDILARLYEVQRSQSSVPQAAPSPEQYASAFRKLGNVSDTHIQMLRSHYNAPERTITATQMVHAAGYSHYSIANSQYGRLGRLVGDQLEDHPRKKRLGTLVTFKKRPGDWHWIMQPQVVEALERLGWGEGTASWLPRKSRRRPPCWSRG